MRPSIARISEQLDPRFAASRHTTTPISHMHHVHPLLLLLLLNVPCRRWQRWRPCHVRAVCLLSPWWAGLGLRYPPNMYTDWPNTSVFVVLLLVSILLFQLPLVPLNLAFSWHVQRNQAAFAWSSSLTYVEILKLSELPDYSFSPSTKFSASFSKTTFPLPSASFSLFLRLSKFHIHMTRLTIHNSITHVTLSLIWFSDYYNVLTG